ncbi:BTAD domain-containing putative transcriptional regulator [Streptomyces sp. HB132]|uniref:AfsR/SARP family transcriptional regulator n=1 Tax=Streptomyces sp. HB132 TaxID=767388 RepID=UPI0023BAD6EC|nr:BTAD domain-containing putative transcriptional regulator [Streptomyces sp. HB132]
MVNFHLLSALEARVDGHVVPLGHPRQQSVLAVLLIDANRPVSADQLLHRVWGDDGTARSQAALYPYISRLRRALIPYGIHIVRRSGGYVLEVDENTVDLHRFRHLIQQAKKTEKDSVTQALLEQGLGLWRGDPLSGLNSTWLDTVREQLEAERWAAELDHTDAMLRSGRHSECLASLSARVTTHPLDERVAGQLLLALYRSGRAAEALHLYQGIRNLLSEELGTDPGPPLRDLHQQILVSDPLLAPPAHSPLSPMRTPSAPMQLPAPPPLFTGRRNELAQMEKLLKAQPDPDSTVPILTICGAGGVGKTWLALDWAHRQHEHFPDGQLCADLQGFTPTGEPADPHVITREFLEALGVSSADIPTTPPAQAALYRSLTTGKRILILLDNAHDTDQVLPLLPGSPSCTVLVTSRRQLPGLTASHAATQLTLETLTKTEARALLARRLGAAQLASEPDAVAEILQYCDGLPLAISILAARVTTNPVLTLTALATELRGTAARLDALDLGEVTTDVRTVFASSYLALDPDSARVFRQLAQAPGPDIGLPAAVSLSAQPPARLRTCLRRLQAHHLVQERSPGRFACHDLLRAYALELAESVAPTSEGETARTRVLDHYVQTAYAADRLLLPHRDPIRLAPAVHGTCPENLTTHEQAMRWFANEHTVLTATLGHAARTGRDTHAWQLAWAITTYLARQGRWADITDLHTQALAAAIRLRDPAAQVESHRSLAWALTETGRYAEAHRELTHALTLPQASGALVPQAHTHLALGWLYEREGDRNAALRHDQSAVDLFTSLGHLPGRARALNAVAWDHAQIGDHATSVRCALQALAIQHELGDRRGEAGTWDTLGYTYHQLGDHAKAIDAYERSLELHRVLGHRYNEAENLFHLGQTHKTTGSVESSKEFLRQALGIYLEVRAPDADLEQVRALLVELYEVPSHPEGPTTRSTGRW